LPADATVASFASEIRSKTSLAGDLNIKYGYPPKVLLLDEYSPSTLLSDLPMKLEGEQLIISESGDGKALRDTGSNTDGSGSSAKGENISAGFYKPPTSAPKSNVPFSFAGGTETSAARPDKPLQLTRSLKPKIDKDDPPDVPLKNGRGTMVLRVMEDDNSCLFSVGIPGNSSHGAKRFLTQRTNPGHQLCDHKLFVLGWRVAATSGWYYPRESRLVQRGGP
jgi:ubiquitin thioesterase OTU1